VVSRTTFKRGSTSVPSCGWAERASPLIDVLQPDGNGAAFLGECYGLLDGWDHGAENSVRAGVDDQVAAVGCAAPNDDVTARWNRHERSSRRT